MIFNKTKLYGAFIIELTRIQDERGFFARAWCRKELKAVGLDFEIMQANISFNKTKHTLRGMHYQVSPSEEIKLVRCTRGAVYDVIIDLRPDSETYKQWIAVELTDSNNRMLYVPKGCAHGYQTIDDNTEVFYQVSEFYSPEAERGVRWNDPQFGIQWPEALQRVISGKDRSWPDYVPNGHLR